MRVELSSHKNSGSLNYAAIEAVQRFEQRFEMKELLHRRILRSSADHNFLPLPDHARQDFHNAHYLAAGSYGEVWRAYSRADDKSVVLKVFYARGDNGQKHYLTWDTAKGDKAMSLELGDAIKECKYAKDLQAKQNDYPIGAQRVMRCLEDHVDEHEVSHDEPLYLVLEDCTGDGGQSLDKWTSHMQSLWAHRDPTKYVEAVMYMFRQMLEGVEFMSKAGYVHHDIKPENIVIHIDVDGKEEVKLVDFGAMTPISAVNCKDETLVASATYAPPEWFGSGPEVAFSCSNPAGYDTYAMAVVLDELITGYNLYEKLERYHTATVDPAFIINCMRTGRTERRCRGKWYDQHIKHPGGSEEKLTGQFMNATLADDMKVAALLNVTMEPRAVNPGMKEVLEVYKAEAIKSNWLATYLKMLAFDADARAGPEEVLKSDAMLNTHPYVEKPRLRQICKAQGFTKCLRGLFGRPMKTRQRRRSKEDAEAAVKY